MLVKTEAKVALSTSVLSVSTVAKSPAFQQRSLIFFVQPFNTKAADEAPLTFLASLNSSWALAFLKTSLNAQAMFPDYFIVTCPFFTIPCKAFLHWSSVIRSLFSQAGLLIFLHIFLTIVVACSCACNMLSLIKCQLSWAPLPFRTFSRGIPCTSSVNKLKSALLNSQSILCYLLSLFP